MDCRTYQDLIAAHVDQALDPPEQAETDAPVRACTSCAEARVTHHRVRSLVRSHAAKYAVPPELRARVLRALNSPDERDSAAPVRLSPRWYVVFAAAISAVVLIAVTSLFRSPPPDLLATYADDVRRADAGNLPSQSDLIASWN